MDKYMRTFVSVNGRRKKHVLITKYFAIWRNTFDNLDKNISIIFGQQSLYRRLLRNPRKTLKCCFKGAAWVEQVMCVRLSIFVFKLIRDSEK